jgi:hypothetical protein
MALPTAERSPPYWKPSRTFSTPPTLDAELVLVWPV